MHFTRLDANAIATCGQRKGHPAGSGSHQSNIESASFHGLVLLRRAAPGVSEFSISAEQVVRSKFHAGGDGMRIA